MDWADVGFSMCAYCACAIAEAPLTSFHEVKLETTFLGHLSRSAATVTFSPFVGLVSLRTERHFCLFHGLPHVPIE